MSGVVQAELSRVTVVAPRGRLDLALPSDVPLASLLPTLVQYVGENPVGAEDLRNGWVLARLGGRVLDNGRTTTEHDIRDGELLYLTPRADAAREVVFDDAVDAVASATQARATRWQPELARRLAVTFAGVALFGSPVALLFAGRPLPLGGLVGLVTALILLAAAAILSRAFGNGPVSVLVAVSAPVHAAVGGLLLFAGDRSLRELAAPHVLISATALMVVAAVAAVTVGEATILFLAADGVGLTLAVGAATCLALGSPPAAGAAVVVVGAFALLPALPMISYRLARLPMPSVPSGRADITSDTSAVDGRQVVVGSDQANGYLTGLLGTVATVVVGAEAVFAVSGGPALPLCVLLAVVLLLRARPYPDRRQRLAMLTAGGLGLGLAAVVTYLNSAPLARSLGFPAGLGILAVVALTCGALAGRRMSPVWGRALDIVEIVLILAVLPLAAWVGGLFAWIRAIKG
jgi:type VII secretion integral membrane protein EccD